MEKFDIYITFNNGSIEKETGMDITQLQSRLKTLHTGVAASMGMIKEVKVVDGGDMIVFLSKNGKIEFPPNRDHNE